MPNKLSRLAGGMTDQEYVDALLRARRQSGAYPPALEPGLEGGVPTEPITGLSPLDVLPSGMIVKAFALAKAAGVSLGAALAATKIASKASEGAQLSRVAQMLPGQRGLIADIPTPSWNDRRRDISMPVGIDPTPSELRELLMDKQSKTAYNTLRTLQNNQTGQMYAWPADAALHQDVGNFYKLKPSEWEHGIYAPD